MKKIHKIIIATLLGLFTLSIVFSFLIGIFLIDSTLGKKDPREASDSPEFVALPALKEGYPKQYYDMKDANMEAYKWVKASSEIVSIRSFDGLKLNAYYKKNEVENGKPGKTAILVHGHKSEPREMSYYAKHFFENGFSILLIGMRGHSWSEGNCIDFGFNSSKDVKSWAEYIAENNPEERIIILGVSMGAGTTMMAAGLDLPSNIVCAVEDCGYSSVWKEFKFVCNNDYHIPTFPVLFIGSLINRIKNGFWFSQVQPEKSLKNAKIPMLFIHGDKDVYVPFFMLDENYNAYNGEKEKLVMEGAIHACNPIVNPEKYWNKVDSFVGKYVK